MSQPTDPSKEAMERAREIVERAHGEPNYLIRTLAAALSEQMATIERLNDLVALKEAALIQWQTVNAPLKDATIAALTKERDALADALRKYGRHLDTCVSNMKVSNGLNLEIPKCTCGFENGYTLLHCQKCGHIGPFCDFTFRAEVPPASPTAGEQGDLPCSCFCHTKGYAGDAELHRCCQPTETIGLGVRFGFVGCLRCAKAERVIEAVRIIHARHVYSEGCPDNTDLCDALAAYDAAHDR